MAPEIATLHNPPTFREEMSGSISSGRRGGVVVGVRQVAGRVVLEVKKIRGALQLQEIP